MYSGCVLTYSGHVLRYSSVLSRILLNSAVFLVIFNVFVCIICVFSAYSLCILCVCSMYRTPPPKSAWKFAYNARMYAFLYVLPACFCEYSLRFSRERPYFTYLLVQIFWCSPAFPCEFCAYLLHVVFLEYSLRVLYVFPAYSLCIPCVFCAYFLRIPRAFLRILVYFPCVFSMFLACSLRIFRVFPACSVCIPCVFPAYSPRVLTYSCVVSMCFLYVFFAFSLRMSRELSGYSLRIPVYS